MNSLKLQGHTGDIRSKNLLLSIYQKSNPKAKTFNLPRRTISSQVDIDAYITDLKSELEKLLKQSSSIILK